ncbi:MAG: glycosyltransferase family 9 protein, partial [Candidatus Eremiobacteraeota bacterium]|nr:glycosyltransferase family 9 protein [Candidatus Eremiobacteraeota bacterium]
MSGASRHRRILVIKLGAFGNVVLSLGAFAAIRRHHANAHVTLLTTAPYSAWMAASPYFDAVWVDERPDWWDVRGCLRLRRRLIEGRFDRVYDLQTSTRSSHYFQLLPRSARPEWSGVARGCSHPDRDPKRDLLHDAERQAAQLRQAGIGTVPSANLDWCAADIARFKLPDRIALLVPGSSAHRPGKRWPTARYGALAHAFVEAGLVPVVLGTAGEAPLAAEIARETAAIDLTGQTSFGDLVSLARVARVAVGNDTGPMHLIAAAGCASVVLFSHDSDPALCAPCGERVVVLRRPTLDALDLAAVRDPASEMA